MIAAKRSGNYAAAREYALILQAWLRKGGFNPKSIAPEEVDATITQILKPAFLPESLSAIFGSLACVFCDAGDEIQSIEEAIQSGWTKIQPVNDMAGTTHLGLCPECRRNQDEVE
jgi:hypothetical protein